MEVLRRGTAAKSRGTFFSDSDSNSSSPSRSRFAVVKPGKLGKQVSDSTLGKLSSASPLKKKDPIRTRSSKRKSDPRIALPIKPNSKNGKVVTALALALPSCLDIPVQSQRFRVISELYSTEINYLNGLDTIAVVFQETLSAVLSVKEKDALFPDTSRITFVTGEFLLSLIARLKDYDDAVTTVGDIILTLACSLSVYCEYCAGHCRAEKVLNKVKDRRSVADALHMCASHSRVQPGLTIQSYLLTPVQRLARYPLLVRDLLKRTDPSHPDCVHLTEALAELEKAAQNIDNFIQERASAAACDSLKREITTLDSYLEDLSRVMQHEGQVCFQTPYNVHTCILFNDIMLFINEREVELCLPLETVWTFDVGDRDPQTCSNNALEILTPSTPYTMYVKDANEKKLWLGKIRTCTHGHLEKKGHLRPNPEGLESIAGLSAQSQSSLDASALSSMTRYFELHMPSMNGRYEGVWCDAVRHGEGTQYFSDGSYYTGLWEEDEMEGDGCLHYATGDKYVGKFESGMQVGTGSLRFWNNDMYTGEWADTLPNGPGKVEFWGGDELAGDFADGQATGQGTLTCLDGSTYKGEFKHGLFHGRGVLVTTLGEEYAGEFSNGKKSGRGEMLYADGGRYVGKFKSDHRHGNGQLHYLNGGRYSGHWEYDLQSGQGKEMKEDGRVYTGMFEHGLWHGKGELTWPNGDRYIGSFEDGFMNGKGRLEYCKPKGVYTGFFYHDKRHGLGQLGVCHGNHFVKYSGEWRYEQRCGQGAWWVSVATSDIDLFDFDPGVMRGTHVERYEGSWLHDLPHGDGEYSHFEGQLTYKGKFANGHRHGTGVELSTSGQLTGYWVAGLRQGEFVLKTPSGQCHESHWLRGSLTGSYTVKVNNKVHYTESMVEGVKVRDDRKAMCAPQILPSRWTML